MLGWLREGKATTPISPEVVAAMREAARVRSANPVLDFARRGRTLNNGIVVVYDHYERDGQQIEHIALSHAAGHPVKRAEARAICRVFWPEGGWQKAGLVGTAPGSLHFTREAAPDIGAAALAPSLPVTEAAD